MRFVLLKIGPAGEIEGATILADCQAGEPMIHPSLDTIRIDREDADGRQ
jgi:hypothetical protein